MMTETLVAVEPPEEEITAEVPATFAGDELPIVHLPADPPTLSAADKELMWRASSRSPTCSSACGRRC